MPFQTPILIIAWRRPETVSKVIEAIKPFTPSNIYVACDGPNSSNPLEIEKVALTRELIDKQIDWKCSIKKLYSEQNNGCKIGVTKAINWFFANETEGIILEDDCIPYPDFLPFAEELLERYRDDSRIWCITANNIQKDKLRGSGSYYFSRYCHCWGWASWRRCWNHYDSELKNWPIVKESKVLEKVFNQKRECNYWKNVFDNLYFNSSPDTWDYQWAYTCWLNSGLTIIPNKNLIHNVGYGIDGTHTTSGVSPTKSSGMSSGNAKILPIIHPDFIVRDSFADRFTELDNFSGPSFITFLGLFKLFKRCKNKILRFTKSF
tara:strand:+ start:15073 stop:16032 length:960 start_codon:yes stop_codon:yes gene_type:complete